MIGNRDKPPRIRMQQMDMAAGLSHRFKPKNSKNFNDFKS